MTGKKIGIVGGGQLGQMLTIAANKLGHKVTVVDPTPSCPASQVGATQIEATLTDHAALKTLADTTDVVTFEIEHINTDTLKELEKDGATVHPSPLSLEKIKDKLTQKQSLKEAAIPTAPFANVSDTNQIALIGEQLGYPFLLKARYGGYDGRGNALIKSEKDIEEAVEKLGDVPLYAEAFIPFEKELAVMVARSTDGTIKTYPAVETLHEDNILRFTLAPAPVSETIAQKAEEVAVSVVHKLHGAGMFGIEMFLTEKDAILINEIAPRVHNSGHYTIEGCQTSQFTQHILAITGDQLKETTMRHPAAVMVNILGERTGKVEPKGVDKAESLPGTTVHLYGKLQTKRLRKMGHITVVGNTIKECLKTAQKAHSLITI